MHTTNQHDDDIGPGRDGPENFRLKTGRALNPTGRAVNFWPVQGSTI